MLKVTVLRSTLLAIALALGACASPQDGSPSSWGGNVRHERINDTDFVITSLTNGIAGPARLRPLLLGRARELAAAAGSPGFVVVDPLLSRSFSGDGHVARAAVRLVSEKPAPSPGFEYFPTSVPPAEGSGAAEAGQVALLVGSGTTEGSALKGSLAPWYVDAVASSSGAFSARALTVRPGTQTIGVFIWVCKPYLSGCRQGSVTLRATLEPGVEYRVTGEVKDNAVYVWLEEPKTPGRIGQAVTPTF
jgi:hypothetical protein